MSDKGIDLVQYGERKVAEERNRIKDAILAELLNWHKDPNTKCDRCDALKWCLEIVEGT